VAGAREKALQAAQALRRFYDRASRELTVEEIQLGLVEITHARRTEETESPALMLPRRSELSARTPRQAQYLQHMRDFDITFCVGPAGTGKTFLAVAAAVDALRGVEQRFEIEALRSAKDHFVARIAGVTGREAAEKLRNLELYIPRARLPAIEEDDTFYHADLVGLDVMTPDGVQVGTVHALLNFGAGDIIDIVPVGGGDHLMLPFNEQLVPKIDLAAKRIVVVLPAETE
jgi:16S rRNA processing protein RimM